MEEQRKTHRSRRAYLNDFHLNEKGEYVYEGKMMKFIEDAVTYRQYLIRIIAASALMLILTAAAECLPAVAMSRFGFTAVPWLGQFVVSCLVIYAAWQVFQGKNPMREYVYRSSLEKLPHRALILAVFSFLSALTETIYILVNGCTGEVLFTVLRPIFSFLCGLTAVFLYRIVKSSGWKPVVKTEA